MTKKDMISAIQSEESRLWTELARYDNEYAPDDGDLDIELEWAKHDEGHLRRVNQWYAVSELLDKLKVPAEHDDAAFELTSELYNRRRANMRRREEATA